MQHDNKLILLKYLYEITKFGLKLRLSDFFLNRRIITEFLTIRRIYILRIVIKNIAQRQVLGCNPNIYYFLAFVITNAVLASFQILQF